MLRSKIVLVSIVLAICALAGSTWLISQARAEEVTTTFTAATNIFWHVESNWTNGIPDSNMVAILSEDCLVAGYYGSAKRIEVNAFTTFKVYSGFNTEEVLLDDPSCMIVYLNAVATATTQMLYKDGGLLIVNGGTVSTPRMATVGPSDQGGLDIWSGTVECEYCFNISMGSGQIVTY